MSKYAVRALAEALVHKLRPHGISVTHASPGFVESEIRSVDNDGRLQPGSSEGGPPRWLVMPTRPSRRFPDRRSPSCTGPASC